MKIKRIKNKNSASIHIKANTYIIPCLIMMRTMRKFSHYLQYMEHGKFYVNYSIQNIFNQNLKYCSSLQRNSRSKKASVPNMDIYGTPVSPIDLKNASSPKQMLSRKRSEPDIHYGSNNLEELVGY